MVLVKSSWNCCNIRWKDTNRFLFHHINEILFLFPPLGKKCTYGHKCKFYHPERGSQPQRAVADELRASAKISSVATRGLLEDALMVKSQSSGQPEGTAETEPSREPRKKLQNPNPKSTFDEIQEDRLQVQSKVEGCGESNNRSINICSSFLGHPAPEVPPSSRSLDQWEHAREIDGNISKVAGVSGPNQADSYLRCDSPELGYSSLVKTYSNLSLVVPQSPECFFPADLRAGSLSSDCSSESSVGSDSFSPDSLLDDGPKCHRHHHPPNRHHCSGQFSKPVSRVPPGLGQHLPQGYPIPQALRRQYDFDLEDPPSSATSHVSPRSFKTPPAHIPPHLQHSPLNIFPGEFPAHPPQTSSVHFHSLSSPLRHNLRSSLWQGGGLQDSRVYEGSPLHSRRIYSGVNQQPQHPISWDPHCQQSPKPCYDMFTPQSHSEVFEKAWHSPWGRQGHSSPRGLSASSLPPLPRLSLPSIPSYKSHWPLLPQVQEPPSLGQYQELRERLFVNLCGIFPPDLVRTVMTRYPHVMDAQELAAAILMEKAQRDSWIKPEVPVPSSGFTPCYHLNY